MLHRLIFFRRINCRLLHDKPSVFVLYLAVKHISSARMKAVFDVWKPKPHQFQAFSHAGNRSHRDLHAAHSLHNRSLPDLPYDCRSLPLHHFVRTFDLRELHISSWEIGNQIPDCLNIYFKKKTGCLSPIPFTSFMDEFNLILLFYGNHIIVNWLSTVMYFHFYIWIFLFHFFCDLVGRILVHFLAIVNT